MDIIPLIKIKNKKIIDIKIENIVESSNKNIGKTIYVLDYDGIEKNKPNLCTYQKLSKHYDLWTDFAPKNLGDVVDSFMTGAKSITIREKYYTMFNPKKIKEISENELFLLIDNNKKNSLLDKDLNGYVNFKTREEIDFDFKYQRNIKNTNEKLYIYEKKPENKKYWEKQNVKGLLVDFINFERFK